jgi:hypothetical protein
MSHQHLASCGILEILRGDVGKGLKQKGVPSLVWLAIIPAFRRLRQEDLKLEAWTTKRDPVSKRRKKKKSFHSAID